MKTTTDTQPIRRLWIDRDSMGHSIAWAIDNLPGLCVRQSTPGAKWRFDLILDNLAITQGGWDWWITTSHLLSKETETPGSTLIKDYPEGIASSVEIFRKLCGQHFQTRKEALQALGVLLVVA